MYARISAWLLVLALVLTAHASAQERFGTLQGRVTDQQGAAIPGVTVAVTSLSSGETRTFVTDANGQFVASDLNPGRYKVLFELTGFTRVERPDVSVVLGRSFEVNTELSVGGVDRNGAGHRGGVAARRQPQHAHRAQRQRRGIRPPAEGAVLPVDRADRAVGERR